MAKPKAQAGKRGGARASGSGSEAAPSGADNANSTNAGGDTAGQSEWGAAGYEEPRVEWTAPADQLQLPQDVLDAPADPVVLRNKNPDLPLNTQKFDYGASVFVPEPPMANQELQVHLDLCGSKVHVHSALAQAQDTRRKEAADLRAAAAGDGLDGLGAGRSDADAGADDSLAAAAAAAAVAAASAGGLGGGGADAAAGGGALASGIGGAPDLAKNQFNFSDRAAQTFNHPRKSRGVSTKPPELRQYAQSVSQWEMYDLFVSKFMDSVKDQEILSAAAKKKQRAAGSGPSGAGAGPGVDVFGAEEEEAGGAGGPGGSGAGGSAGKDGDVVHSEDMSRTLRIVERMVNQNAELDIYEDFKFWEDQSDVYRDGEGSLLPLWRFSHDRAKRKHVTALAWNPALPDLFAVGYGSYDFVRQGSGMIHCFSLKNTASPEYSFSTEAGVMCLAFHPQPARCALLAAGCYDGSVMVFDVRSKVNRPIYLSTIKTGKHTDPVWEVRWQTEDMAKELGFFSISSDGRVASFAMSKSSLKMEPLMQLKLVQGPGADDADEDAALAGLAGGCCFDFNSKSEHLFLVGTEEGRIHKCSKAYSGQYLQTYEGHHMAVYAVRWNKFHPRVFLSCSADWTVKLWDHASSQPVLSFDLGNPVGDVAWAPYSSTVFAAVTSDGKVHVFDLAENKHEALCEQKVVKKAKLTHLAFNPTAPVLLVGDDRGGVNSLKLSPNLRKPVAEADQLPRIERVLSLSDAAAAAAQQQQQQAQHRTAV